MESFEKFSFQMQKINFVLELHAIFLSKEASCPPTRSSHKNSSILYFLKTILARLEWRMRRGGGGGGQRKGDPPLSPAGPRLFWPLKWHERYKQQKFNVASLFLVSMTESCTFSPPFHIALIQVNYTQYELKIIQGTEFRVLYQKIIKFVFTPNLVL